MKNNECIIETIDPCFVVGHDNSALCMSLLLNEQNVQISWSMSGRCLTSTDLSALFNHIDFTIVMVCSTFKSTNKNSLRSVSK